MSAHPPHNGTGLIRRPNFQHPFHSALPRNFTNQAFNLSNLPMALVRECLREVDVLFSSAGYAVVVGPVKDAVDQVVVIGLLIMGVIQPHAAT